MFGNREVEYRQVSKMAQSNGTSTEPGPLTKMTAKEEDDDMMPSKNMYHKTRAMVTNLLDAALMISNISNIAGIYKRRRAYVSMVEVYILMGALISSIMCQIIAAFAFMTIRYSENEQRKVANESEKYKKLRKWKNASKVTSYACVFLVMVLNMFIGVFANVWDIKLDDVYGADIAVLGQARGNGSGSI